jgi:hypothetical protein
MSNDDPSIGQTILKRLRVLTWATVVVAAMLIGVVGYVYVHQSRTTDALCTFKRDLVQRRQQSQNFLKAHPKGAFGFSPAQIQQGIDNYGRTVDSLSPLHCPPTPVDAAAGS